MNRAVLHSGSAGVVGDQQRGRRDEEISKVDISELLRASLEWRIINNWVAISSSARNA